MSAVAYTGEERLNTVDAAPGSFDAFLADASVRLRRAFVARYGLDIGIEACSEAIAWACANQPRLMAMTNPVGYLYRVGQSSVRAQVRWHRAPLFPAERAPADVALADDGLHVALAKLSRDQRSAVMLVHAHGYRYAEAAEMLDIPVTTLKNHLNRGLARLRRHLEQDT